MLNGYYPDFLMRSLKKALFTTSSINFAILQISSNWLTPAPPM
jgi:hypothetical protein